MRFPQPLIRGRLIRRYKRFLADVQLAEGMPVTAHCANSGSMTGLAWPGASVLLSRSDNPRRKLAYTWELVHADDSWVGIHTGRTNALVREALAAGLLPELDGYDGVRAEAPFDQGSRLDFCLTSPGRRVCWLEVKSVTLRQGTTACFPDAVTLRGRKHLANLTQAVAQGQRGVLLFVVQRQDCRHFCPAEAIDPAYALALRQAAAAGVDILVRRCRVGPDELAIEGPLSFTLDGS